MSQIYMKRREQQKDSPAPQKAQAGPSTAELAAGVRPTGEQMGHRVDLPDAIREKMENSFGADFSHVRLYESGTVAEAGAEAVTQGSNIAFAPGKLDLTSTAGQALLGHELSHVVSQARGESAGRGFLNDAHLEAQADRQGMMAAQGESVYSGPVTPIGTSSAAGAAGPMQAKKKKDMAQEALTWGDVGDLPDEKLNDEDYLDGSLNQYYRDLTDVKYNSYIKRRAAAGRGDDTRDMLEEMRIGSPQDIDEYIRQDVINTYNGMKQASKDMNGRSFKKRANALINSGMYMGHAKAIMNDPEVMHNLLNVDEREAYYNAMDNFKLDRQVAKNSMMAHAPDSERHEINASKEQKRLRKLYRKERRKGTDFSKYGLKVK